MIKQSFINKTALLLCALALSLTTASAQTSQRDQLGFLKRAITQAGAPTLTAQQETDLNALITAFKAAQPSEPDAVLEAARDAYDAALIAGNLAAAQTQATAIATRQAQLSDARLRAEAQFVIAVFANLRNGGQFAPLQTRFGDERLLDLAQSLVGHGPGGGRGPGR
jgi:hypothetical protein